MEYSYENNVANINNNENQKEMMFKQSSRQCLTDFNKTALSTFIPILVKSTRYLLYPNPGSVRTLLVLYIDSAILYHTDHHKT